MSAPVQITIPPPLLDWVEAQVLSGRYADASDYLRDLILRDQQADDILFEALEEGAKSGVSTRSLDDIWQAAKAKSGHG
jgi:antitoxin ParD1/3/4